MSKLTKKNTAVSRYNAATFGIQSRYTVLPWESRAEYDAVCGELLDAYNPVGPVEAHLVEEVAGVIWRKQRLRLAEASLFQVELSNRVDNEYGQRGVIKSALLGKASKRVAANGAFDLAEVMGPSDGQGDATKDYAKFTRLARDIDAGGMDYEKALNSLPDAYKSEYVDNYLGETFDYEVGGKDREYIYEEDAGDVAHYIRAELLPELAKQVLSSQYAGDISEHLQGASFNARKLDNIGRYETTLDRKLERMLSMLIKMQEIRSNGGESWKTVEAEG